jgi:hypothetical protein
MGSAPCAAPAIPVDHEVVTAHGVPQAAREPLELPLEALVLEGGDPAALLADGVVVVLAPGDHGLETRAALAEFNPLNQAKLLQDLERPVDAGDPDVVARLMQPI